MSYFGKDPVGLSVATYFVDEQEISINEIAAIFNIHLNLLTHS